jgi:hypothetical protein
LKVFLGGISTSASGPVGAAAGATKVFATTVFRAAVLGAAFLGAAVFLAAFFAVAAFAMTNLAVMMEGREDAQSEDA